MQEQQKNVRSPRRFLLAAAVLVALAGLTAIYVIGRGSGNDASIGGEATADQCQGARQKTAKLKGLNVGDVAAFNISDQPEPVGNLAYKDENGADTGIAALKGKTVLLNLWATWCAPCRREMPALDALEKEMGGERFAVVPVAMDLGGPEKPRAFYAEIGVKHLPFFHDGTMGVFNELKKRSLVVGMPTSILLDKKGCILGSLNGPAEWASPDARALIEAALDKPASATPGS